MNPGVFDSPEVLSKKERELFKRLMERLKRPSEGMEGRGAFLKANPVCSACEKAKNACLVTHTPHPAANVRCVTCVKQKKQRCPRQKAFEVWYISKEMSKAQDVVLNIYEEYQARMASESGKDSKKKQKAKPSTSKPISVAANQPQGGSKRIIIEILDDDSEDATDQQSNREPPPKRVKIEPNAAEGSNYRNGQPPPQIKERPVERANTVGREGRGLLVDLSRDFGLLRVFLQNFLKPYRGEARLKEVENASQKIDLIGQRFSQMVDIGRSISVPDLKTLVGDLVMCKDRFSLAIDVLRGEDGYDKLSEYCINLEEIVLGFGAVLSKEK